jgi:large subunit ribosomal protein L24
VVKGVNIVTKHRKPTRDNQRGGIEKREAAIHLSNVMLADPQSGEPTRIRFKNLKDGKKVRVAVKSGEQLDT